MNNQEREITFTDIGIARAKPEDKRYTFPDPKLQGHTLRVTPNGAKSFAAVARDPHGKQVWATLGRTNLLKVDQAREMAREAITRIKAGLAPFEAPPEKPDSFRAVAERYLQRHVLTKKLRSEKEIIRYLETAIYPAWEDRDFESIKRSDVTRLLDGVEDKSGASQADHVLSVVSGIMRWYEARYDDYVVPLARQMRRVEAKATERDRILDDNEIRAVWNAAKTSGSFGSIVRLLLLTAQRRAKVASMRWQDISDDGIWTIPTEDREKGNAGALKLPPMALDIIREISPQGDSPFMFPARVGGKYIVGWSPLKRRFDAKLADQGSPLSNWRIHDLRRTARSLMARAGVRPDIAERVMGHALQGVEGVYDRHRYDAEKADALAKLAGLLERIIHPTDNVVHLGATS